MSTRREFVFGALAVCGGGVLAACAPLAAPVVSTPQPTAVSPSTRPPAAATATVAPAAHGPGQIAEEPPPVPNAARAREYSGQEIGVFPFGGSLTLNEAVVRRFSQDTGIRVRPLEQPHAVADDAAALFAFFQSQLQSQSRDIDALAIDAVWPGALAMYLVDLEPKLGADAKQHYPAIIHNNTVDGRLVGMPTFADFGMLYYRSDLLQKYDFAGPPRTWDELEQQAQRIVAGERPGNPAFAGFVFQGVGESLTCNALEWLASSAGGNIVDNGKITVNNPRATAILDRVHGWIGGIAPAGVVNYQEEDARNAFQSGNAAFMRNWPYAYAFGNGAVSPIKGKFGAAPLPVAPGQKPVGTVGGFQWAVSQYSRAIDAAVEWVRYATSPDVQSYRARVGSLVPTIPGVAASPEVLKSEPFLGSLQDVVRVARPAGAFGAHYAEASAVFSEGISQILKGQKAGVALPEIERQLQRLLVPG